MTDFATSYMPATTGGEVERLADVLPMTFGARPQAMTIYCRFIERGTIQTSTTARVLQIGSSGDTNPRLAIFNSTGVYRLQHQTRLGSVTGDASSSGPTLGQAVELLGLVDTDGSVQLNMSVNSAAVTEGTASSGLAFADAWSAQQLWLGGVSDTLTGFTALREVVCHRGVQSIDTMRRVAGVS